jgi:transposase
MYNRDMDKYNELTREQLIAIILAQGEMIEKLIARVAELEEKLAQNSNNSSKPPSSDGLAKPPAKSLRTKTGRKPGGQKGHKGSGLKIERAPDEIVVVEPKQCACGCNLTNAPTFHADTRYVYDAKIIVTLTRYDIRDAVCPDCGDTVAPAMPIECKGTINYGHTIRALCVVLTQYAFVSIDKTHKILHDLIGLPISTGTIKNIQREFAGKTGATIDMIKKNLHNSYVLGADETGARVNGKTQWIHVLSNSKYTLLTVHKNRGREGAESAGVLQGYTGVLEHDFWKPYFGFDKCKHAVCCAHLLRELNALIETGKHPWASDMKALLLNMKKAVDNYKSSEKTELSHYYRAKFKNQYKSVIAKARESIPQSVTRKKSKAENLLNRFSEYEVEITRFTQDFDVPFDNNQAERDVRNVKVKQKVSGCLRTEDGAKDYVATASVVGTIIKFGQSVFNSVRSLFDGDSPDKVLASCD